MHFTATVFVSALLASSPVEVAHEERGQCSKAAGINSEHYVLLCMETGRDNAERSLLNVSSNSTAFHPGENDLNHDLSSGNRPNQELREFYGHSIIWELRIVRAVQ